MTKIDELRQQTYEDLIAKLHIYHKCALIRPCSFGKTVMAVKLFSKYNKVLFLYPADCIRLMLETRHEENISSRITFMSYNMLARLSDKEIENLPEYDLVFSDEAHRLGGEKTKASFFTLMNTQGENTDFVGSTATPDRMDGFDFIQEFFDGIEVEKYTLHDAIRDSIIKKPYYYFSSLNPKRDMQEEIKKIYKEYYHKRLTKNELDKIMTGNIVEKYNIFSVENIIKESCTQHIFNTGYMKFICFFLHIQDIKSNFKMIANWFKQAFPNHQIRKTEIHSGNSSANIKIIESLKEEKNTIDLIFACDMLNEGYHVDNITGIVMLRKTRSNRIYNQQIGRCLSSDENSDSKLIFDIVDNIHCPSIFEKKNSLINLDLENVVDDNEEENLVIANDSSDSETETTKETKSRDKRQKDLLTDDDVFSGTSYVSGEGWYNPEKFDMVASSKRAMYEELAKKAIIEKNRGEIELAMKEYLSRGFLPFKDRTELTKASSSRRALLYISKAHNIPLPLLYAAFESKFRE